MTKKAVSGSLRNEFGTNTRESTKLGKCYPLDDIPSSDLQFFIAGKALSRIASLSATATPAEYDEAEQKVRCGPKLNTTELGASYLRVSKQQDRVCHRAVAFLNPGFRQLGV